MRCSYQPPAWRDGEDEPSGGLEEAVVQHQEDHRDTQEDQHDTHRPRGVPGNKKMFRSSLVMSGQVRSDQIGSGPALFRIISV